MTALHTERNTNIREARKIHYALLKKTPHPRHHSTIPFPLPCNFILPYSPLTSPTFPLFQRLKGLLDRDSFASQLATQMQMERLHPKIEMLLTIHSCRVPCIYAQASHCAALQQCAASVHRERVLLTRSPNG